MAVNVDASAGTHAEQHHRDVAVRMAAEIRRGPGLCRFAKTMSLMHAFRWPGTHLDIEHVLGALNEQGIEVSSGPRDNAARPKVSRRDVLELTLNDAPVEGSSVAQEPTVRVSAWRPGEPGMDERRLSTDAALESGPAEVLCFDRRRPVVRGLPQRSRRSHGSAPAMVLSARRPHG